MEFSSETGALIPQMELALRRDERIMRFLTVSLDKYGIKYNQDKRDGKIGKAKKRVSKSAAAAQAKASSSSKPKPKPAAKAPVAKTPVAKVAETPPATPAEPAKAEKAKEE